MDWRLACPPRPALAKRAHPKERRRRRPFAASTGRGAASKAGAFFLFLRFSALWLRAIIRIDLIQLFIKFGRKKERADMIRDNVEEVRERVEKARAKAGLGEGVAIVAVTKNRTASEAREAFEAGLRTFGENRVQELLDKWPAFKGEAEWHMIGTLQKNKIKPLLGKTALIQSLDSVGLAEALSLRAKQAGVECEALVQFNAARESQKHGFLEEELKEALDRIAQLESIRVSGVMMMAPDTEEEAYLEQIFTYTRNIFEQMTVYASKYSNIRLRILSMGMTNDYECAIRCGSNMVRIGRALFR
jgi:pyridoxal phosphate enzyme (YggS family)